MTSFDAESVAPDDMAVEESAAPADGASFLTRQEETADRSEIPDDAALQADADMDDVVPSCPEDYALNFAEGLPVDEGLLSGFKNAAHELGLRQGQAQALADFYAGHVAQTQQTTQSAQKAALLRTKQSWEEQITARPAFKQEMLDARRMLKEFGSPELNEIMDVTLLGSHPVFFEFAAKIGRALAEPAARGTGVGGHREKPLMDRLWPDMK